MSSTGVSVCVMYGISYVVYHATHVIYVIIAKLYATYIVYARPPGALFRNTRTWTT